MDSPFLLS